MRCSDCSREVRPIVCLDIDGTLGAYHEHFLDFAEEYFDVIMLRQWDGEGDWEDYLGITKKEYREVKLAWRQGGGKRTMPCFLGAQEISEAARTFNAEVWITTTRPWNRLDSVDPDTQEWLRRNRIYHDFLLYDDDKYGKLAEITDGGRVIMVLDDLPEQYDRAAAEFGEEVPLLIAQQHNVTQRTKRASVRTLFEAQVIMEERLSKW